MPVERPSHSRSVADPSSVLVAVTTLALASVMLLSTLLYPFLQGDERHHIDMVWWSSDPGNLEQGWPGPARIDLSGRMENSLELWHRPRRADNAIPMEDRPRTEDIPVETDRERRFNRATLHPPLFYVTEAAVIELGRTLTRVGPLRVDLQWWFYRLVNLSFLVPLPFLVSRIARRLTDDENVRRAATVSPLLIPGLTMRVAPMTGNDTLLILLGTIAILLLLRVVQRDDGWAVATGLGASVGLAASTKAFGLVLFPTIAIGYLVALHRSPREERARRFVQAIVAASVASLLGLPWYVRNVLVFGQVRPDIADRPVPEQIDYDWSGWIDSTLRKNLGTFFGGREVFGPTDAVSWIALLIIAVGLVLALRRASDRALLVLVLLPALLLAASFYTDAFVHYLSYGREGNAHARYYYMGLPGILAASMLGLSPVRHGRWYPALVGATAVVVTVIGAHALLTHGTWWGGEGGSIAAAVAAVRAWSPVGMDAPVALAGLVGATLIGLLATTGWTALRPDAPRSHAAGERDVVGERHVETPTRIDPS